MHRYHLVRTLHLTDPLPTDALSLKVSANLITAAAAWVKADRPRQIAFVLEHQCDDKTSGSMSFGMLKGRDAALAQLLRGVCDGAGQASCSSLFFVFVFVLHSFVHLIRWLQAVYEARLCCACRGISQVLPKRWDRRRGRKKHGRSTFDSSDDSAYEYSSGELSDLELGYEEESATYSFDIVDANGKKEDYWYDESDYYGEDIFLNVESVDEIALRFHSKSADKRPVFDDPTWW